MANSEQRMQQLRDIMARLRTPDGGCPWDLKQDYRSLVSYTLEEAYEVADAIEQEDYDELKLELGDLLFQVVFYARLAEEEGRFDFDDVTEAVCEKLIRRHPHVFADQSLHTDAEIKANWEKEKAKERAAKSATNAQHSVLDDIPLSMPSLSRAAKIQKRCAHVGFDWPDIHPVLDKLQEEVQEFRDELNAAQFNQAKAEEELGDLMFAMVNMARHIKADPETVLRRANQKFERRFRLLETLAAERQLDMVNTPLPELDAIWDEVKSREAK